MPSVNAKSDKVCTCHYQECNNLILAALLQNQNIRFIEQDEAFFAVTDESIHHSLRTPIYTYPLLSPQTVLILYTINLCC